MPSNKDKKSKKVARVRSSRPKAEEPSLPHTNISHTNVKAAEARPAAPAAQDDKYKFTEDYLNWLEVERGEMSQRQVNQVTERIFDSVLSKLGWARNEAGNLEHLGE